MILLTFIARVADGLPLAASMLDNDERYRNVNMVDFQTQAKQMCRRLSTAQQAPPSRCSIDAPPSFVFHYLIERGCCCLCLTDRALPARTAFSYLEEVARDFLQQYGDRIHTASRPYTFIEFETHLTKIRRNALDQRQQQQQRTALDPVRRELGDVQRIMVDNIDQILNRQTALEGLFEVFIYSTFSYKIHCYFHFRS